MATETTTAVRPIMHIAATAAHCAPKVPRVTGLSARYTRPTAGNAGSPWIITAASLDAYTARIAS